MKMINDIKIKYKSLEESIYKPLDEFVSSGETLDKQIYSYRMECIKKAYELRDSVDKYLYYVVRRLIEDCDSE